MRYAAYADDTQAVALNLLDSTQTHKAPWWRLTTSWHEARVLPTTWVRFSLSQRYRQWYKHVLYSTVKWFLLLRCVQQKTLKKTDAQNDHAYTTKSTKPNNDNLQQILNRVKTRIQSLYQIYFIALNSFGCVGSAVLFTDFVYRSKHIVNFI